MLVTSVLLNHLTVGGIPGDLQSMGLSGVVYGVLGNDPALIGSLGGAVLEAPYKAPPKAPVLYVKPRNTLAVSGAATALEAADEGFEVAVNVGMVIGQTACRVTAERALGHVSAFVAVADLSIPHEAFYRPSLRFKARDGSCLIGSALTPASAVANPDDLVVRVLVDGQLAQVTSTAARVRSAAQLLQDVTEFMTLRPGDILLLGASHRPPLVRAGQRFVAEVDGLAPVSGEIVNAGGAK